MPSPGDKAGFGAALLLLLAPAVGAEFHGVLVSASQVNRDRLQAVRKDGASAVVLSLAGDPAESSAARRLRAEGFDLYYWIEIGRNPQLAEAHPEWMTSLQGHPEWRRFFPNVPSPKDGEVVKNFPWVPVLYKESFDAHVERVARLLKDKPAPAGIFLNDLQGAPSACGCGNTLCRWVTDYGPIRTTTRLGSNAAASFAAAVGKLSPDAKVIPVWMTECEENDKADRCAGVGCFTGSCWRENAAQLAPVVRQSQTLAALVPYRAFGRDLDWVTQALLSFARWPPKREAQMVPVDRVIAVLQGWDATPAEVEAQVARSKQVRAAGYVISLMKIEQDWQPRIVPIGK